MAAPSTTFNAEGNIRASSSLAAGATATYDIDASTKLQLGLVVKNTPGSSVSTTRGVMVRVYARYGTTPSVALAPTYEYFLNSQAASTPESTPDIRVPTGKWRVSVQNYDTSNAVTVEITSFTVDSIG